MKYVLIEKKNILISQLLQITFPQYRNKVVYAINTLMKPKQKEKEKLRKWSKNIRIVTIFTYLKYAENVREIRIKRDGF